MSRTLSQTLPANQGCAVVKGRQRSRKTVQLLPHFAQAQPPSIRGRFDRPIGPIRHILERDVHGTILEPFGACPQQQAVTYSYRSACMGSIVLARLAGRRLAPIAVAARIATAAPTVARSVGFTPKSCDAT